MGGRAGLTLRSRRAGRAGPARAGACVAVVAALVVLLAGCSSLTPGRGRTTGAAPSTGRGAGGGGSGCPAGYATADPRRPVVRLDFTVSDDLATVTGREHVVFTPDRPITELVFRLTANTAPTVAEGNSIRVTSARADHGGTRPTFRRAGAAASTQGGLLVIPLSGSVPAGTPVSADLAFSLRLGAQSFDRFGRTGGFAWFASAQPLLAWQRGYGWHDEDLIAFTAESATSEAMSTDLTVTAPAAQTVIMSGDPATPTARGGTRTWHATIATARDVSVAVGPFQVSDTRVGGVRLRVGAYDTAVRDALVPEFRRAITELATRFGPFPFPSLSVARLPAQGGGIEYPSSILMLDGSRLVAVHETAHQWFYAMVGDSQSLHPWLDEAFAQFAEEQVDGTTEPPDALHAPGPVDRSVESYGADEQRYYYITYDKGAAALQAARSAAGPARFDAALRCYVNANAWRIARPSDLAAALKHLPAATAVLRSAGALP